MVRPTTSRSSICRGFKSHDGRRVEWEGCYDVYPLEWANRAGIVADMGSVRIGSTAATSGQVEPSEESCLLETADAELSRWTLKILAHQPAASGVISTVRLPRDVSRATHGATADNAYEAVGISRGATKPDWQLLPADANRAGLLVPELRRRPDRPHSVRFPTWSL
jgi:hypothetical protein